ncbi:hypothetical protein Q765_13775 [Flavobacterium rivuli WB 3.3-2 = DSM 21788]|uniref:HNH nuclease domain-containing protein n=1 Tax=Flavobacterium rivuli WB 3.3-2 = DSM 21788 TaxID=1121895 RepID=A0A0A2LZT9_9FLAO|nr:HNH endonuclease domain-containing protein [Flavobacterium rivuli]KGO85897.1 hypothetical protein Q765_13775 [Flavobacterium rivuli WB 3.3-2 = DSM 21788]
MYLPPLFNLPVNKLAATFGNTSATYKFYWLLALTEALEEGSTNIQKKELFSRMIAGAWYTVNYFHISFGKQDQIQDAIEVIAREENMSIDMGKSDLLHKLLTSSNPVTHRHLNHFNKNVPHWFLTPWFPRFTGESDGDYKRRIYTESQYFENQSLYALHDNHIEINPEWITYLQANAKLIKDFCFWNLALFLQSRNPNVPDIPGKLFKPPFRGTLANQRKNYWDIVFKELGTLDCIFTNTKLQVDKYALDHFVPHAFVSHDLIWNLIPIDKSFNAFKSDKLPSIEQHFDKFYKLQKEAFDIISSYYPKNKLLEEYLTIFPALSAKSGFEYQRYKENIQPLISIAQNNGFLYL